MDILELTIERPAAGGRMIARHDGIVVLVAGAIPGERVRARVEKVTKHLLWARTIEVLEASPSRREPAIDPACGGCDYLHIAYDVQRALKAALVDDAFRRIGKLALPEPVVVLPSPESGYRLRARLHVEGRRAGFYLEGTHVICDAAPTRQLRAEAVAAVEAVVNRLGEDADRVRSLVVSENVLASERVLHVEFLPAAAPETAEAIRARIDEEWLGEGLLSGVSLLTPEGFAAAAGRDRVTDRAIDLFGSDIPVPGEAAWARRATSFFQGNRFLTGELVRHVLALAEGDRVADLYAGVGLFAVALAARGQTVVAVEGDRSSGEDLEANAAPWRARLRVIRGAVEHVVPRPGGTRFDTVVIDPPRTGLTRPALRTVVDCGAARVVYVSCEPATLARDAAALVAEGYRLASIRGFDLFPNTAHVETVALFERR